MLGTPELRNDWQDLGTNRFNEGFQNSTINGLQDFAYPSQYGFGNAGKTPSPRNAALVSVSRPARSGSSMKG